MILGLGGGLIAVTVRNILHAVFGLAITLLAVAGLFLYLHSPFVAAMEVIIYVGGISVAMVFAVMLSRALSGAQPVESVARRVGAGVGAAIVLAAASFALTRSEFGAASPLDAEAWSVRAIGKALLLRYNLVFETLSVVLLIAIMGAVVVAQRPGRSGEDRP